MSDKTSLKKILILSANPKDSTPHQEFKTLTIKVQAIYEQRFNVSQNALPNLEKELAQCLTKLSSISSAKAEAEKFLLMILTLAHWETSREFGLKRG